MKHYIYTLFFALLCVFTACSNDDENELGSVTKAPGTGGTEADIAKESELTNALCASPGVWKMMYEGEVFYFRFKSDNTVESESNLPYFTSKSVFKAKFRNEKLTLNISGGGHLAYLSENLRESTLLVSGVSAGKITCTGSSTGKDMSLTSATDKEFTDLQNEKGVLVGIQSKDLLYGVIRDKDSKWKAHYIISSEKKKISFVYLENRVAKNIEVDFTIEGSGLKWTNVSIAGAAITGITYNNVTSDVALAGSNLSDWILTPNSDVAAYFDNRDRQFQISKTKNIGDAKDDLYAQTAWQYLNMLEVNCAQDKRPLVAILNEAGGGGYIFYDVVANDNDPILKAEGDRVYFLTNNGSMPYGGDPKRLEEANATELNKVLAAWYHTDGLYLIKEVENGSEYIYFVSPTTENWFKAKKTK